MHATRSKPSKQDWHIQNMTAQQHNPNPQGWVTEWPSPEVADFHFEIYFAYFPLASF